MSTYGERAEHLFHGGYNCAQAVLLAFSDVTHLDEEVAARLASPFGAGMGRLREVCGAFSGALMVLGLMRGPAGPDSRAARREVYGDVQQLAERFRSLHGSIVCGELLGIRQTDGAPRERPHKPPCPVLVRTAADMTAEMLNLS